MKAVATLLIACLFTMSAGAQITSAEPAVGTYHWANGQPGVDAFAQWLGRDTVWALDFVGNETWDNVGWPTWWLEGWSKWVKAKPGRRLILSIPMLTGPFDLSGPTSGDKGKGVPVSLEQGAKGEYNAYYHDLAENLVRYGIGDTIVRPGWEFNGGWYAWRAQGKAQAFAGYWREIVKTMRAVPGAEKLTFLWNPTLGYQQFPAEEAWPGNESVDYVGVDVYDETWMPETYPWPVGTSEAEIEQRRHKVWKDWIVGSDHGLAFWSKFAREHGKPLAIPEWGVQQAAHQHGGLDDVHFIEQMHAFLSDPANHVAFHCYFDVNAPDGSHQLSPGPGGSKEKEGTVFPKSAERFRELFGVKR